MRIRFDPFVLDDDRRELLKEGVEVHLSPKAYELLKLILELRPRAVSKEELHRRLWGGTHVSDATLTALVGEVREALGECGRRHGRIRTLHGFGYAFDGTATALADSPPDSAAAARAAAPEPRPASQATEPHAEPSTRPPAARTRMAVPLLFVVGFSVAGYASWRSCSPPPPAGRNAIVIADVDNRSGYTEWDGALEQALAIALEQSGSLAIVDAMREAALLKEMGYSPNAPITRDVARDLCRRADATALVAGAVVRAGQAHVLGLEAELCGTGAVVAREQRQVTRQEDVIPMFGRMASALRLKLCQCLASAR